MRFLAHSHVFCNGVCRTKKLWLAESLLNIDKKNKRRYIVLMAAIAMAGGANLLFQKWLFGGMPPGYVLYVPYSLALQSLLLGLSFGFDLYRDIRKEKNRP